MVTAASPIDLAALEPSRARAEAVSERMQARLAESLRYIIAESEGVVPMPKAGLDAFLRRLASGPVSPQVFGAYCDLVLALDADALDEAERLFEEIAAAPNIELGPRIVELAGAGENREANRYHRFANSDPDMPLIIEPPPAEVARKVRRLLDEAFTLVDAGHPDLGQEIRVLIRELVLALGSDNEMGLQFDGISAFMLWGGVILNVSGYKSVLDTVQALAHESGHNLLFGLCVNGPLHDNDDEERYPSPLRRDLRPMDGIVHATYVSARMHQAVQRLLDAGVLNAAQRDEALRANLTTAKGFAMGMETIDRHAKLTDLGRGVMERARRYMAVHC
jgi:hypothetical protein